MGRDVVSVTEQSGLNSKTVTATVAVYSDFPGPRQGDTVDKPLEETTEVHPKLQVRSKVKVDKSARHH